LARITTGGNPCGVVAVANGAWVSDAANGQLLRIDRRSQRVTKRVSVDKTPCELMAAYGSLWLVTQSGRLDRLDPASGRVLARVPVGKTSYEAIAALGDVFVSNRNSGTISRVSPKTNRVVRTYRLPILNPGGVTFAGDRLWIGNDASGATDVLRLDPTTGRSERVKAGARPAFVAALGSSVWIAGQDDGSLTRLDARTGARQATLTVCSRGVNLDAMATAAQIWVPCDADDVVVQVDAMTNRVLRTWPVTGGPAVVAPGDGGMWVTAFEAGVVHLLPTS
jgi:streptogramin lyase